MSGFQDQEFKSNLIYEMAIAGISCGIVGGDSSRLRSY